MKTRLKFKSAVRGYWVAALGCGLGLIQSTDLASANTEVISVQNSSATLTVPKTGFEPHEVALLVNTNTLNDPQSMEVAMQYQAQRGIPAQNLIYVQFPNIPWAWDVPTFEVIRSQVMAALSQMPNVQALVVTSQKAGRASVGLGMSFSSAMTYGYSDMQVGYARTGSCTTTPNTAYYNSESVKPRSDLGIIPTVVLAGGSVQKILDGMARGISSDSTFPGAHGYFVRTTDANRSVRYGDFQNTVNAWNREGGVSSTYIDNSSGAYGANYISGKTDVLFYLTGMQTIPEIETNTFVPGALADHLTSFGGKLDYTCCQMGQLNWLDNGVVASYGTISEPCNYTAKFPRAAVLVAKYFSGASAMEAYLKSVQMQGEGHSGSTDPLARPYKTKAEVVSGELVITTSLMKPNYVYKLQGSDQQGGQYVDLLSNLTVTQPTIRRLALTNPGYAFYRLLAEGGSSGGGGTGGGGGGGFSDTVAPTISITSMSVQSGKLRVQMSASDNQGVAKTECFLDGVYKARDTKAPYSVNISLSGVSPGPHAVQCKAFDLYGNIGVSQVLTYNH